MLCARRLFRLAFSTGLLVFPIREMTQAQTEILTQRIESQHDELLRKIDELDHRIAAMLEEWTTVASEDATLCHKK